MRAYLAYSQAGAICHLLGEEKNAVPLQGSAGDCPSDVIPVRVTEERPRPEIDA